MKQQPRKKNQRRYDFRNRKLVQHPPLIKVFYVFIQQRGLTLSRKKISIGKKQICLRLRNQ